MSEKFSLPLCKEMPARATLITRCGRQYLVSGSGVQPLRSNKPPVATTAEAEAVITAAQPREQAPTSPEPEDIFAAIAKKLGSMCVTKKKK